VDSLTDELHGQISILSLVNEVMIDTPAEGLKPDAAGQIPMMGFLQRLARHVAARGLRAANGEPLPLYCGGFTRLDQPAMQTNLTVGKLLQWCATDPAIAGVDFHLHEFDLRQFATALDFIRRRVPVKPFIVTEYSMVWEYKEHLNNPLGSDASGRAFCAHYQVAPTLSVLDYLNNCLRQRVSQTEWDDFLKSQAWFDPHFLKHTGELMAQHGVVVATYAFTQRGSGGGGRLRPDTTPWMLNPIFVSSVAHTDDPKVAAVNTAWFDDYLGFTTNNIPQTPQKPSPPAADGN
jgi:hypothetical protein